MKNSLIGAGMTLAMIQKSNFTCADCTRRDRCDIEKISRQPELRLEYPFDPHEAWNRVRRRVGLPEREGR
jgi:hypothetical protein